MDEHLSFDLERERPRLVEYFTTQPDVVFAYLFGSHARGQANPLSDVDFAVLLDESLSRQEMFDRRLDLVADLIHLLEVPDVDVAVLDQVHLALAYRVFRDGILVFCRDRQRRILYQADIVSRYLDFKPFLDRHERATLERARRGELGRGYNPHHGALKRYRELSQRFKRVR